MNNVAVIVTAAGSSTRLNLGVKKEFLPLKDGTVLSESVGAFVDLENIKILVVTYSSGALEETKKAVYSNIKLNKKFNDLISSKKLILTFCEGSDTRQKSVYNGLKKVEQIISSEESKKILNFEQNIEDWIVLIHDGARPFIPHNLIEETISAVKEYGSAVLGIKPVDSVVKISEDNFIEKSVDRSSLCFVQTPQGFMFSKLLSAYEKSLKDGNIYTDDTSVYHKYVENSKTKIVSGSEKNKKITYKSDLELF